MTTFLGVSPAAIILPIVIFAISVIIGNILKFSIRKIVILFVALSVIVFAVYYLIWKIFIEPSIGIF